jgi:hypothetical protein
MTTRNEPLESLEYEEFVARSFEALKLAGIGRLSRNCHFVGKSGHRHQIDIAIELSLAGLDLLILIECKSYRRSVEVADVLELIGRLHDISAHKGVIVTTVGFQEGAVRVARANRIALVVTAPQAAQLKIEIGAAGECKIDEDDQVQGQPESSPGSHTTVAWFNKPEQRFSFKHAWGAIAAAVSRDALQQEVKTGNIKLSLRCPACRRQIFNFARGMCRRCRSPLESARTTNGVWYKCDCGMISHHTELDTEVAVCECRRPRSALSREALEAAAFLELCRDYRLLF